MPNYTCLSLHLTISKCHQISESCINNYLSISLGITPNYSYASLRKCIQEFVQRALLCYYHCVMVYVWWNMRSRGRDLFCSRYNHFCLETNKEEYRTLTVNMYKKMNLMQVIVWPIICFFLLCLLHVYPNDAFS